MGRITGASVVALLAAISLLCGCSSSNKTSAGSDSGSSAGSSSAASQPLEKVTYSVVVATPDPGQTFAYIPIAAGYFKDAGLDVTMSFNNGASAGVQQVLAGKAQFGLASPEAIFAAQSAGAKLTAFATNVTKSIYTVGVLADSGITSYSQLKGKKIGVRNLTSGAYPSAQEAMAQGGATGVQYVSVGTGGQAAQALRSGQVQALVTSDTDWVAITQQGIKVSYLPRSTAQSLPADLLYSTTDYFDAHKKEAAGFARAVMRSTAFAKANPAQAEKYYEQIYPDAAKAATPADNIAILSARVNSQYITPGQNGQWGYIQIDKYQQLVQIDLQYKVISKAPDLDSLLTNELIDQINTPAIIGGASASKTS
jgi:NitT/TauT family transport system substrate-binding protein